MRLRIYLDACCLSRLTDDQSQQRVRVEAESVEHILRMVREGLITWVSSTVLNIEVNRNPNPDHRRDAQALVAFVDETIVPERTQADRAREIEGLGFGSFDALHLACAEKGAANVFLTTDDNLLRLANRNVGRLHVLVKNPVSWYEEVR